MSGLKDVVEPVRVRRNCDFPWRGSKHGEWNRCRGLSLRNRLRRCGLPTHHSDFRRFGLLLRTRRPRAGIKKRQSEQNERGNQRAPSEYAVVSSAVGSIHDVVATIVVSFSHVSTGWSTSVAQVCSVMKWPMGQAKFAREPKLPTKRSVDIAEQNVGITFCISIYPEVIFPVVAFVRY